MAAQSVAVIRKEGTPWPHAPDHKARIHSTPPPHVRDVTCTSSMISVAPARPTAWGSATMRCTLGAMGSSSRVYLSGAVGQRGQEDATDTGEGREGGPRVPALIDVLLPPPPSLRKALHATHSAPLERSEEEDAVLDVLCQWAISSRGDVMPSKLPRAEPEAPPAKR
jgi:hypothetical protein